MVVVVVVCVCGGGGNEVISKLKGADALPRPLHMCPFYSAPRST